MIIGFYLIAAVGIVGILTWAIILARTWRITGWITGSLAAIPFSVLFMIKLRCSIDAYPCGFMSLRGGFSWHLVAGLILFLGLWALGGATLNTLRPWGWKAWMRGLGRAMAPLLGLSGAMIWETLPVWVIHPQSTDGSCPNLPILCHDLPLMGFGGLLYWTTPFLVWTALTVRMDVGRMLVGKTSPLNTHQPSEGSLIP